MCCCLSWIILFKRACSVMASPNKKAWKLQKEKRTRRKPFGPLPVPASRLNYRICHFFLHVFSYHPYIKISSVFSNPPVFQLKFIAQRIKAVLIKPISFTGFPAGHVFDFIPKRQKFLFRPVDRPSVGF